MSLNVQRLAREPKRSAPGFTPRPIVPLFRAKLFALHEHDLAVGRTDVFRVMRLGVGTAFAEPALLLTYLLFPSGAITLREQTVTA